MSEQLDERHDHQGNLLPKNECPTCRMVLDAATCAEEGDYRPGPGDICVCWGCGETLAYDQDMEFVLVDLAVSNLDKETLVTLRNLQQHIRNKENK